MRKNLKQFTILKNTSSKLILALIVVFLPTITLAEFDHHHKEFSRILSEYVHVQGSKSSVDYEGLMKEKNNRLRYYLESLSTLPRNHYHSFTKEQKLAFFINAYNGYTLSLVLKHYPVKSIKDIKVGGVEAFDLKFFKLLGMKMSLNDLEHRVIRINFNEPRIHFALVCAAKSCPPLSNQAYTATNLYQHLERATKSFLGDHDRNFYDKISDTLYLSKIFDWYSTDFPHTPKVYVSKYIPSGRSSSVKFVDYDWRLNAYEEQLKTTN